METDVDMFADNEWGGRRVVMVVLGGDCAGVLFGIRIDALKGLERRDLAVSKGKSINSSVNMFPLSQSQQPAAPANGELLKPLNQASLGE